jgi:hypothetical protein
MEILYRDRPGEESRGLARRSFVDSSEILFSGPFQRLPWGCPINTLYRYTEVLHSSLCRE